MTLRHFERPVFWTFYSITLCTMKASGKGMYSLTGYPEGAISNSKKTPKGTQQTPHIQQIAASGTKRRQIKATYQRTSHHRGNVI